MRFTTSILILSSHLLLAQGYEGSPCAAPSKIPRQLLQAKELTVDFYVNECNPDLGQLYSSYLKASGKGPLSIKDPNFKPPPDYDEAEGDEAYDRWTCMYSGGSAIDGNTTTAWVEGKGDDGAGELLLLTRLDLSKKVEILAGFGKTPALFTANSRPKRVVVHVVRAGLRPDGESQCGFYYQNLKIVTSGEVTLRDLNGFQPLPVPAFKPEGGTLLSHYWLLLELVDVYPGSKYKDTCITEVRNTP